ncbi:SH3 domain-containing protein [Rossellomorea marisflavi]|uniref:SH3 domain-containing protein n=1 Tax=Rossellomorea marisflavi TaxID=189381 RepID=UPI00345A558F
MVSYKRIFSSLLALSLVSSGTSSLVLAASSDVEQNALVTNAKSDALIHVYSTPSDDSDILTDLKAETEVTIVEEDGLDPLFSKVSFKDAETGEEVVGYILTEFLDISDIPEPDQVIEEDATVEEPENTEPSTDSSQEATIEEPTETDETDVAVEPVEAVEPDETPETNESSETDEPIPSDDSATGEEVDPSEEEVVAKEENVEKKTMRITSFAAKTMEIGGASHKGLALKNPTPVYESKSLSSKKLKTYNQGSVLLYKELDSQWYLATVYINGKATVGYINKQDVSNITAKQVTLHGIAVKAPTNIYGAPSAGSSVLKSYNQGSSLKYQTYIDGWYVCSIYVNGKYVRGYINASDVQEPIKNQTSMKGVAQTTTRIYTSPSASASTLKSYSTGSVLYFKTFINGWYEATVYIKGKATTGYIKASDVTPVSSHQSMKGLAKQNIPIYSGVSTGSSVLKSYSTGSILYYKSFISGWYEATVYVNGSRKTGYLQASKVENFLPNQHSQEGLALNSPTKVYSTPTTSSSMLKSYPKGTLLKYKTLSENWYEATVYIKGTPTTGYINKKDVKTLGIDIKQSSTDYGMTIEEMLAKQMKVNPQTDKYWKDPAYIHENYVDMKTGKILGDVNVRSTPVSTNTSNIVQTLNKGSKVTVLGKQGSWVEVRITWKNATAADTLYNLDPSNVKFGSKEYYQFLKLSLPANLSASEINQKILKGKGVLEGKGQAFVDAANKYKVNEIYLLSHALHETGNGTSKLAQGIKVGNKVVYNMYGYGAFDSCAEKCGAETADEYKWYTPEAAIIGGAQIISQDYIYRPGFGQDTIYKMRWTPGVKHQYATDVGWASKQVDSFYDMYALLDNYTLNFDTPYYTPSK